MRGCADFYAGSVRCRTRWLRRCPWIMQKNGRRRASAHRRTNAESGRTVARGASNVHLGVGTQTLDVTRSLKASRCGSEHAPYRLTSQVLAQLFSRSVVSARLAGPRAGSSSYRAIEWDDVRLAPCSGAPSFVPAQALLQTGLVRWARVMYSWQPKFPCPTDMQGT
jgi:hypothetical protein